MIDGWLDVTTMASAYEIQFRPSTCKYRHRRRRIVQSEDPSVIIIGTVGRGEWKPGKPPHYPT